MFNDVVLWQKVDNFLVKVDISWYSDFKSENACQMRKPRGHIGNCQKAC